jgi:hypothetical protein
VVLTGIYKIFHPTSTGYIFFSAAHGTFSKIDQIIRYKEIFFILSDHNGVKL